MPEAEKASSDEKESNKKKKGRSRARFWFILYGALVLTGLIVGGLFFRVGTDRARFWTENLLTASILAAIIVQAIIYAKQRGIMEEQLQATKKAVEIGQRAYVGVQKIEWDKKTPTPRSIYVEVANAGNVPAENVVIYIDIVAHIALVWAKNDPDIKAGTAIHKKDYWYGSTKLFRGNLPILIRLPVSSYLHRKEIALIYRSDAIMVLSGQIQYWDGFDDSKTDFLFSYYDGNWTPAPPGDWFNEDSNEEQSEDKRGEAN